MTRDDYWGTKADLEHELDDAALFDAHERHECQRDCDYCAEEKEVEEALVIEEMLKQNK